jgi:hypothetical protein
MNVRWRLWDDIQLGLMHVTWNWDEKSRQSMVDMKSDFVPVNPNKKKNEC